MQVRFLLILSQKGKVMKQLDEIYCKVLNEQLSKTKFKSKYVCRLCKTNPVLHEDQSCRESVFMYNTEKSSKVYK